MRVLSATEAISPAIDRTKAVLFRPFRKGRTWKLSMTVYLARASTIFLPLPLVYLVFLPTARKSGGTGLAMVLIVGLLLLTAIGTWLFHLCTRLSFAFFDIVVNRGEFVAPAWSKYGPPSRKWSAVKILLGTIVTVLFAAPLAAYFHRMISTLLSLKPGQPPPPEFVAAIFASYAVIYLGFGSFYFISALLGDFVMPSLALENTTLSEAFRRFFELIRLETGQMVLYAVLKFFLGIGIYMGVFLAYEIVVLLVTLILALIFGVIGFLLHLIGVTTALLIGVAILIGVIWYLLIAFYGGVLLVGAVLTFFEAYGLYFLGGRYPLLGQLLDASELPPAAYIPPPGYMPPYPPPPQMG